MKKLYNVIIETEVIVVAENEKDARRHAMDAMHDVYDYDFTVSEFRYLTGDMDLDSIPFGDRDEADPDRTIQGWIDAGAGEAYRKQQATLERQKAAAKKTFSEPSE